MRARLVAVALVATLLGACQTAPSVGAACTRNTDCSSPLVCRFGRCRTECTAQRDCAVPSSCLLDEAGQGSCSLVDDPDCTASSCASPLACVGRECVNLCSVGVECPAGSTCAPTDDGRARCVRTDGVDASLPDASFDDAALAPDASRDAGGGVEAGADAGCGVDAPCSLALEVAVGDGFSCAVQRSTRVVCWGRRDRLGRDGDASGCDGTVADAACPTPAPVRAEDAEQGVGDAFHAGVLDAQGAGACFQTPDADVLCWGAAGAPLGRGAGATGERARHVETGAGMPVAGLDGVFVLDGSALAPGVNTPFDWYGWGADAGDVFLHGTVTPSPYAAVIDPAPIDVHTITVGARHACGIDGSGHVVCWGANESGQVEPTSASAFAGPIAVPGVSGATELMLGVHASCALTSAPVQLICWGSATSIGAGIDCGAPICAPGVIDTGVAMLAHVARVHGTDDLCVMDAPGAVYCWGAGTVGGAMSVPHEVASLPPTQIVRVERDHACAVTSNSEVYCWGRNDFGQLGLPADITVHGPTRVPLP